MKKNNLLGVGIDTLELLVKGVHDLTKIENRYILKDKTTYTKEGNTKIVVRGEKLLGVNEMFGIVKELSVNLGVELELLRMDISADSKGLLKQNKTLCRLFLECLNVRKRKEQGKVFKTVKGIAEEGNIKISSKRFQFTFYDSVDKARIANMRGEYRILDIRIGNGQNREIAIKEIKKYIEDIKELEELIEKVENKYIEDLYIKYNETIEKNFRTFTSFIEWADYEGYILTIGVLKGLMKKIGITSNATTYAKNFRRLRSDSLNFTTKTELKKFIKELEKGLKNALKK